MSRVIMITDYFCWYDNIEVSSDYYSKISLLENRSYTKNERISRDKRKREIKSIKPIEMNENEILIFNIYLISAHLGYNKSDYKNISIL